MAWQGQMVPGAWVSGIAAAKQTGEWSRLDPSNFSCDVELVYSSWSSPIFVHPVWCPPYSFSSLTVLSSAHRLDRWQLTGAIR